MFRRPSPAAPARGPRAAVATSSTYRRRESTDGGGCTRALGSGRSRARRRARRARHEHASARQPHSASSRPRRLRIALAALEVLEAAVDVPVNDGHFAGVDAAIPEPVAVHLLGGHLARGREQGRNGDRMHDAPPGGIGGRLLLRLRLPQVRAHRLDALWRLRSMRGTLGPSGFRPAASPDACLPYRRRTTKTPGAGTTFQGYKKGWGTILVRLTPPAVPTF